LSLRRRKRSSRALPERSTGWADAARAARLLSRFTEGRRRILVLSMGLLVIAAVTAVFEAYPLA
jgi:hypothetical protein